MLENRRKSLSVKTCEFDYTSFLYQLFVYNKTLCRSYILFKIFYINIIHKFSHCFLGFRHSKASQVDSAAARDSADTFLAETIRSMEEKMNDSIAHDKFVDDVLDIADNTGSGNVDVTF